MEFETKLYNPAAQPEGWLIEHFVARTKVFKKIFNDIETSPMKHAEQHYLIQGQRGMGKTSLLLRLKYEIERTDSLNAWLMPVFFNEESYDLTSLSSLWEKLLKYFDDFFPDGGTYYSATDKFVGREDYEQKCFELVTDELNKKQKKLLILFDNFGELFLDNLDERDSHRFREILMTCADIRIVAASSVVLESHNDYSEPFFDFFKIINLEGLKKDETIELIRKLQKKSGIPIDVDVNRARIETLAILTGGVIRTIIMLYEILLNDHDGSALKDLEKILDAVTPLYKHRMEDLKPQQRRIMDVIAKNWDAISVKEISENIREKGRLVESKKISAQLQELEKNNLIEKIKTSTKNNFYIVKERFFNIWYLMRHGDKTTQSKVKWLTRFLEAWYESETGGMDNFIKGYIKKLQSGGFIASSAVTMTNALLGSSKTDWATQAILLHATETVIPKEEINNLHQIDIRKLKQAVELLDRNEYLECIALLEKIVPKSKEVIALMGAAHLALRNYEQSIDYLSKTLSISGNKGISCALGIAYYLSGNGEEALPYLLESLPEGEKDAALALADIYKEKGEFELAEKYYKLACSYKIPLAYSKLADFYVDRNDVDNAIVYLSETLEFDVDNWAVWGTLGFMYMFSKAPFEKVEHAFNKSIELNDSIENLEHISPILISEYISGARNKMRAGQLAKYLHENSSGKETSVAFALIWNNQFEKGINLLKEIIFDSDEKVDQLLWIILLLMAKKQLHSTLEFFQNSQLYLKERLRPAYYALMFLLKDEYPDEYLKMGKELEEPVKDILETIEQYAIDYA